MALFSSGYRITQKYGNNPTYYSQWGFNGHEGLDCVPANLQQSWDVLTPEKIEIVRDYDTPRDNYGVMVVGICWETKRSWWFCHLEKNYCKVGDVIEAGKPVGKMGNTGNSSGAHLHLGVRECDAQGNPINLNNGYKGFINPLPLLEKNTNMTTELEACMADRAKFWKERDEARAELTDVLQASKELVAENEELRNDLSTQGETLRKTITEKESLVDELNSHVLELAKKDDEIKLLTLKLNSIPQTPEMSPTLSNVISLFRLWLKGWLK